MPPPPQKSPEKERVEESRGLRALAVEDVEREGLYLVKRRLFSAMLPALPRVPGVLPRAPVVTWLQHLELLRLRPSPSQGPAPNPAHSLGGVHAGPPPVQPWGERARRRLRTLT